MSAPGKVPEPTRNLRDHLDYEPNELLVSLAHSQLVLSTLRSLGISAEEQDTDVELDLARIRLVGDLPKEFAESVDPVGLVLYRVRSEIREVPWGWTPTIGRNRLIGLVNGTNGRVIVGVGDPVRTAEALPARTESGTRSAAGVVRVGMVDTALRSHTWLHGGWASPVAEPVPTNPPLETYQAAHSTFIAGLILSRAPDAAIEVLGVLDNDGRANCWDVAKGIVACGRRGVDIINLSLACYTADGRPPLALSRAINRLNPETVVVAAAGNEGESGRIRLAQGEAGDTEIDLSLAPAWPAALDGVIAVGAANADGTRASYSQDGEWLDVLAPSNPISILIGGIGSDPGRGDGYARWKGTSFSAAQITGEIAARTVPGRLSARQAWIDILSEATAARPRFLAP